MAGRMPVPVSCPWCSVDGTELANEVIRSTLEKLVVPARAATVSVQASVLDVKVHCACGTRYIFEVRPVDGRMPMPVFCPWCGEEGTNLANSTIEQALKRESDVTTHSGIALPSSLFNAGATPPTSTTITAPVEPAPPVKSSVVSNAPKPPPVEAVAPLKFTGPIRLTNKDALAETATAPKTAPARKPSNCLYHRNQVTSDYCRNCEKPICLKCMQDYGYFCSIRCRHEADARGLKVPDCPHQRKGIGTWIWQKLVGA